MTGEEFREWRERIGFTQAEIAAQLSVTEMTIYRWETNKAPIAKVVELALRQVESVRQPQAEITKYRD